jgi:hypothetical protein
MHYMNNFHFCQHFFLTAFLQVVLSLAVPVYYGSLILQAFMGMRHGFKEQKCKRIEKWGETLWTAAIHLLFTTRWLTFLFRETAIQQFISPHIPSRLHLHPSTPQPIISIPTAPPASSVKPRHAVREIQMCHARGEKISEVLNSQWQYAWCSFTLCFLPL